MIRNNLLTLLAAVALAAGLYVTAAFADDPPAPFGNVTLACDSATFSYMNFGSGPNTIHEQVFVDGNLTVDKTFTFSGSSGTDVIPLNLTGTHTMNANATWTVSGGGRVVGELDSFDCAGHLPGRRNVRRRRPDGRAGGPVARKVRQLLGSAMVEAELALQRRRSGGVQGVRGFACDADLRRQLDVTVR